MEIKNITLKEDAFPSSHYGWWWSTNPKYRNIPVDLHNHNEEAKIFLKSKETPIVAGRMDPYEEMWKLGFVRVVIHASKYTGKYFIGIEGYHDSVKLMRDDIVHTYEQYDGKISELNIEVTSPADGPTKSISIDGKDSLYPVRQIRRFIAQL